MTARTDEVSKDQEKPLLSHLSELALRLRKAIITLFLAFIIFFAFGITFIKIGTLVVPIPYPNLFHSFSTIAIYYFIHHDLPSGLQVINIRTFDPLYASAQVSFLFSLAISVPVFVKEIWGFVSPGLYEHEKRIARSLIVPAALLFLAGASFAYFIIVPVMMDFVLLYVNSLGIEPTISLSSFVSTLVTLVAITGIAFEYPLIMSILTYAGIVKAESWKKNWRWGILISFIIAWIISPGVTGGVIETTIGVILSILYLAGTVACGIIEKKQRQISATNKGLNPRI
ncbi:translocase [Candidatus Acidianus copahuensis]|uniref:Sec-independent protein translocase protein TatC n=1 Tax=Candidatus Acidianus copahuensis TaxID=1160895 RepID=A0A031LLF1_9CREN|nr:twin-arginine translocase subunit TatC [Candidatus Acidianus copahuensis]EZQ02064.1 translocase [Candidatus Acidianus copahuensis]